MLRLIRLCVTKVLLELVHVMWLTNLENLTGMLKIGDKSKNRIRPDVHFQLQQWATTSTNLHYGGASTSRILYLCGQYLPVTQT